MNAHNFFIIAIILLSSSALAGSTSAATVTLSDGHVAGTGEETTVHLLLDEAPYGLAGYFVNISFDPSVAKITNVVYPSWAVLKGANDFNGVGDVELKALDAKKGVQAGAKNIELATITIQGLKPGSTILHLHDEIIDSDTKGHMARTLVDGSFTVGNVPVATSIPTTVPQVSGTTPANPTPAALSPGATPKVTYSPTGSLLPILGIILGIVCVGGLLRRR